MWKTYWNCNTSQTCYICNVMGANKKKKGPPVIRKSEMNSGPNDMTIVHHRGTDLPIRKAELGAWMKMSAATKDGFVKDWNKLMEKGKVKPDLMADSAVTLFKKV